MLGYKKESKAEGTFSKAPTTIIAKGTQINGDLRFQGNLDISGTVTGNIVAIDDKSQMRVLPGGYVKGEVSVPFLLVNGVIEGDIYALKHLEFSDQARVKGNTHYNVIEIAKGAQVQGNFIQQKEGHELSSPRTGQTPAEKKPAKEEKGNKNLPKEAAQT